MEARFILYGKEHRATKSEAEMFSDRLVKTENEFVYKTGKPPTHLILGKMEWAQFHGWMAIMRLTTTTTLKVYAGMTFRGMTFRGMQILEADENSLMVAARNSSVS